MKINWAIRTTDKNLKVYRATLVALGYDMNQTTLDSGNMGGSEYLGIDDQWAQHTVQRASDYNFKDGKGLYKSKFFGNMEDFLVFHFSEKSPKEIELDKLNQQLVELQAQINVVKQSIAN